MSPASGALFVDFHDDVDDIHEVKREKAEVHPEGNIATASLHESGL